MTSFNSQQRKAGAVYRHYKNRQLYYVYLLDAELNVVKYAPLYTHANAPDYEQAASRFFSDVEHAGVMVPRFRFIAPSVAALVEKLDQLAVAAGAMQPGKRSLDVVQALMNLGPDYAPQGGEPERERPLVVVGLPYEAMQWLQANRISRAVVVNHPDKMRGLFDYDYVTLGSARFIRGLDEIENLHRTYRGHELARGL